MQISIIVPLLNEEESIKELYNWIDRVLQENQLSWEVIFIDDGSTDSSWDIIMDLYKNNSNVKAVKFKRNYGKSAALNEGFIMAEGDVVFTMDADLQDSPDELPEMYRMITEDGYDLVSGWKKERHDPFIKRTTSKFYNRVTRHVSKIKLHDFNCGLKAYKKAVVKDIEVYGEMHRYIPLMAKKAGYNKIGEKVVKHQARKYGTTKFGMNRFINGFLDLLTINFVNKYGKDPMHLFGALGVLIFMIGFICFLILVIEKFFFKIYGIADRPLFYFGILGMIIGSQLFMTGFLGELITRNSVHKHEYNIDKVLNKSDLKEE